MRKFVCSCLFLTNFVSQISAQDSFGPINIGSVDFLTLPTDARILGIGGAGIALVDNNSSVFYNGATVLFGRDYKNGLSYTYAPWIREHENEHSLHSGNGYYIINTRNAVYAGVRFFNYPKTPIISDGMFTNDYVKPNEWAVDFGYSHKLLDNLAVSATLRFIYSKMDNVDEKNIANGVASDIGAVYCNSLSLLHDAKWAVGLTFNNFGPKLIYKKTAEQLPMTVKVGGSVYLPVKSSHQILVVTDIGYRFVPSDIKSINASMGLEYILFSHFIFRGGYHYGNRNKGDWRYDTVGIGLSSRTIRMDFSWVFAEPDSPVNNTLSISCGVNF